MVSKSLHTTTNIYLMSLAVADIITLLSSVPQVRPLFSFHYSSSAFLFLLSILNRHCIKWWYCLLPASESHRSAYDKYSWQSFKLSREIYSGAGGQILIIRGHKDSNDNTLLQIVLNCRKSSLTTFWGTDGYGAVWAALSWSTPSFWPSTCPPSPSQPSQWSGTSPSATP